MWKFVSGWQIFFLLAVFIQCVPFSPQKKTKLHNLLYLGYSTLIFFLCCLLAHTTMLLSTSWTLNRDVGMTFFFLLLSGLRPIYLFIFNSRFNLESVRADRYRACVPISNSLWVGKMKAYLYAFHIQSFPLFVTSRTQATLILPEAF